MPVKRFIDLSVSAFLLCEKTCCSGGKSNGTVFFTWNCSGRKEDLQRYSFFLGFTGITGISLSVSFAQSYWCHASWSIDGDGEWVITRFLLFHIWRKFFTGFPYKWKALLPLDFAWGKIVLFHLAECSHQFSFPKIETAISLTFRRIKKPGKSSSRGRPAVWTGRIQPSRDVSIFVWNSQAIRKKKSIL